LEEPPHHETDEVTGCVQEKAAVYFERAAKAGDPTAAGNIGQMYALGIGVQQNNETARSYYVKGEAQGSVLVALPSAAARMI
jgi:TPR repeat protein